MHTLMYAYRLERRNALLKTPTGYCLKCDRWVIADEKLNREGDVERRCHICGELTTDTDEIPYQFGGKNG